ncbi:MAG: 6-carboxytetrahydropterin synthase [Thermodesulfobacteriota bacterium]
MYHLAVERRFAAHHHLIHGAAGPEAVPHEHQYRLQVELAGAELDASGFLCDICLVAAALDALCGRLAGQDLNRLPPMAGLNPSLESLARICHQDLASRLDLAGLSSMSVRIWESDQAWAAYTAPP